MFFVVRSIGGKQIMLRDLGGSSLDKFSFQPPAIKPEQTPYRGSNYGRSNYTYVVTKLVSPTFCY